MSHASSRSQAVCMICEDRGQRPGGLWHHGICEPCRRGLRRRCQGLRLSELALAALAPATAAARPASMACTGEWP